MKWLRPLALFVFGMPLVHSQTFQLFLDRVNSAPDSLRPGVVDSFMATVTKFPIVEQDTIAHFIYRGSPNSVTVPGDANNWTISSFPMTRVSGTDFWYCSRTFESDARLDYKFVINGSNWILDPRNPNQVVGGLGANSELKMPKYPDAPEIRYYPDIPHGSIWDTIFSSAALGNSRRIRVYTPPNYETSTDSFGVILFHDGLEYISLAQANNVIDYLISKGLISPIIAVFVPPVNRTPEYAGDQMNQFSAFIVNEMMPFVDQRFRTKRDPTSRAVLGASYGGNISLWLGYNYPEVFGNVAAQSSYIMPSISSGFQNSQRLKMKLYLDLGTYDVPELIPLVRNFIPVLQSKGYLYLYHEYHEGHSWGNWRAHIDDALLFFFGTQPTKVHEEKGKPEGYRLYQNYPNPFNPQTTISYELASRSIVWLGIFDLLGRKVVTLISGEQSAGYHQEDWRSTVSSGTYFLRLVAVPENDPSTRFSEDRKIVVLR
jgi:enterochelin esterase-like enzyme